MNPGERFALWREQFRGWYLGLQARERVLVVAAVCGVLVAAWDAVFIRPLERDIRNLRANAVAAGETLRNLEAEQAMRMAGFSNDPNQALREELDRLLAQADRAGQELIDSTNAWVSPGRMVGVLQQILRERGGVRMVAVETLPPLRWGEDDEAPVPGEQVFEHAVEVTLEADYFSLLAYLESLESLPAQFLWDVLDYRVTGYPEASVRLRLKTLSASPEVLEVGA